MAGLAEDAENKMLPYTIRILDQGKRYNVRLYISGNVSNCDRGARSVVLACTPEDSECQ